MNNNSGGIGFCGLLTILFIYLKLTGSILWSWSWVLRPLWIPFAMFAVVAFACMVCYVVVWAFNVVIKEG